MAILTWKNRVKFEYPPFLADLTDEILPVDPLPASSTFSDSLVPMSENLLGPSNLLLQKDPLHREGGLSSFLQLQTDSMNFGCDPSIGTGNFSDFDQTVLDTILRSISSPRPSAQGANRVTKNRASLTSSVQVSKRFTNRSVSCIRCRFQNRRVRNSFSYFNNPLCLFSITDTDN
jgi:hypothetical protein